MKKQKAVEATTVACAGCGAADATCGEGRLCGQCGNAFASCDECPSPATRHRVVAKGNTVRVQQRCQEHVTGGRWHRLGVTAVVCPRCDGAVLMYAEGGRCGHCGESVGPCDRCPRAATRYYRVVAGGNRVRLEARCEEHANG